MDKKLLLKRFDARCAVVEYLDKLLMDTLVVKRDLDEAKVWAEYTDVVNKKVGKYYVDCLPDDNQYIVDNEEFYYDFSHFLIISQNIIEDEERANEWVL